MARTKEFYLLLLQAALLEIRCSPTESDLSLGPALADVLHNVPGALRLPWTEERDERIYTQIRDKANAWGLTELLDRMESFAEQQLAEAATRHGALPPSPGVLSTSPGSSSQTE